MLYMGYIGDEIGTPKEFVKEGCKQWTMKKTYHISKGKEK